MMPEVNRNYWQLESHIKYHDAYTKAKLICPYFKNSESLGDRFEFHSLFLEDASNLDAITFHFRYQIIRT